VLVYGVIDSRDKPGGNPFGDVLGVHLDRQAAEQELCAIVGEEPGWEPFMLLVEIDLATGTWN